MASCRNKAAHDTHFPAPSSAPGLATRAPAGRHRPRGTARNRWGSARNGSSRPGRRQRSSHCGCRAGSSAACAVATRSTRCCARSCRSALELADVPGYVQDPVGDLAARAGPGVLHKYAGRALLVTTGACAINCRYCFRRHFPYDDENASRGGFGPALAALRGDASIDEVILSGGDPLTLGDRRLGALLDDLQAISHLRRVRLHTRLPIVLPERIDAASSTSGPPFDCRRSSSSTPTTQTRSTTAVRAALARLAATGSTLLNQSVLLRGINDDARGPGGAERDVVRRRRAPVLPAPARPRGRRGPFRGPRSTKPAGSGRKSRLALPGYLVPRLVREIPGAPAKTMLPPASR